MAGPRQAGKFALAKRLAATPANHFTWNWDIPADRRELLADPDTLTSQGNVKEQLPTLASHLRAIFASFSIANSSR